MGRLVVVTGTGTEIGKTHLSEALLRALGTDGQRRVAGIKPVESGVTPEMETDAQRLGRASTFHVKHTGYAFPAPVSPHLAAREQGLVIDVAALAETLRPLRADVDVLLVELPGGLFSPLSPTDTNADLARRLAPDFVLLVCPDRLGVLHDVGAVLRAARGVPISIHATAVVAPTSPDSSTGRNAAELVHVVRAPGVLSVPRAAVARLAGEPAVQALARQMAMGPA
jgi:dethiobiotin synthetase